MLHGSEGEIIHHDSLDLKETVPANKETLAWLQTAQQFSTPDFEQYDYQKREQWVVDNIREWTFEQKVLLYLTILLRNGLHDQYNTHVGQVAKFRGHDLQPYIDTATEGVDAPKPEKERKAKKEKAQSPVVEPPSAEELPSKVRLKGRKDVQQAA